MLNRWAFGSARQVIAISQRTRQLMVDADIPASKIVVVPCGADAGLFYPGLQTDRLRARLGIGGSRVILTVGQLSERKAQDVVIRALPRVLQAHPHVVYVMVGLPTRRTELERLARDLGVGECLVFAGVVPTDELPYYYNLADLFVLPSRTARGQVEGYGIVAAEAALCSVPVVVSRDSGFAEAATDGESASPPRWGLVTPDDAFEMADVIVRLLGDDALSADMGGAGRRYILDTATWARRMERYRDILEREARGA
jgi:phosphatidylinositol alpha-1,6-mannosyltransferase